MGKSQHKRIAHNFIDLQGQIFGRLTAIEFAGRDKNDSTLWLCHCSCGKEIITRAKFLRKGVTRSCGCFFKETLIQRNTTHNMSRKPEYYVWRNMLARCNNPKDTAYFNYGGRGIKVCKHWHKFENFFADMGMRPSTNHTLGRIDNNKGYGPGQCRWETLNQQARNKRNNRLIAYNGKIKALIEWAEGIHMRYDVLQSRLKYGWSIDRAMTQPVRRRVSFGVIKAIQ